MSIDKIWVLGETPEEVTLLTGALKQLGGVVSAASFNNARPEEYAFSIAKTAKELMPAVIATTSTKRMRFIAAQVAAQLDTRVIHDCSAINEEDGRVCVDHLIYGGKVVATERVNSGCAIVTVAASLLSKVEGAAFDEPLKFDKDPNSIQPIECFAGEASTVNLASAKRVVSVGRGFVHQEDLALAQELASSLGAELACTRPIAEGQGWLPRERYVGVSGAMLVPDLFVAVGLSGQIQHMVGVQGAKTVVAINKDKSAPIFNQCDYGVVADLYEVLPQLSKALNS